MKAPLLFDARALSERCPTGVSVVAGQFLARLRERVPALYTITTEHTRSNSFLNAQLALRLRTLESVCGVPADQRAIIFSPNVHFTHARFDSVPVQVVHDLSFVHAPYWFSGRSRLWHTVARARERIVNAALVIAVSEFTARDVAHTLGVPPSRIRVIHPHTPPTRVGVAPSLPFSDAPFFLFLGTLEKRKNVDGVIAAFTRARTLPSLRDFHLVLAGKDGFGAPRTLPAQVHHLAYPNEDEKWWLLRHACALVYPSFFEGFGLPPLEAAAVGCPTIISHTTALRETIGNAGIGVSPYDMAQLVIAFEALATDDVLRARCTAAGAVRAAWYSEEKQHRGFDALCAQLPLLV